MPRLYALSDPHLSLSRPKPMDVFGPRWDGHVERLRDNWFREVECNGIVLVPGDVSWAMRLPEARADLDWLAALPGRKVLMRGNHDYWWPSLRKLQDLSLPDFYYIQNNHVVIDGVGIGGSRLWDFPFVKWGVVQQDRLEQTSSIKRPAGHYGGDDDKIRAHEIERLKNSLAGIPTDVSLRVAMVHYPPLGEDGLPTPLTDIIGSYDIDICVFGHIHGERPGPRIGEDVRIGKTRYVLAASDHLGHAPLWLADIG